MTERTSNKQLLDAIEAMPAAIAAAIATVASGATPVATSTTEGSKDIKLDKAYEAHVGLKVQKFANDRGEPAVMYARLNGRGETKLAYCLHSKWSNLKDRGLIGAISTFKPEA